MKRKILGLIPTRLGSKRLPAKALILLKNIPLIVHVYKRAKLANLLDDVIVCCDDDRIMKVCQKYNVKSILTSKKHLNGTERIAQAYKKLKKKFDYVVDIQGDEPLISPFHINQVINYHLKNAEADIILPTLKVKSSENKNIVKVVTDQKNNVLYISRSNIPNYFLKPEKYIKKHLSIISFKPKSLIKFSKSKQTNLEKIENVELLRALETGLKIKSIELRGDSFSIDVRADYLRAKKKIKKDKFFKLYN